MAAREISETSLPNRRLYCSMKYPMKAGIASRRSRRGGMKDRRRAHAEVEIVAKRSRFDHRAQVAIRRRDQPQINLVAMRRADRLNLVRLDRAQQLGLELERQLADLVQEQRAAVGRAEIALRFVARVGKGATHVTEQLRLGQRFDQVGAVQRHERTVWNRPQRMKCARDQFLARSGFARNQHRRLVRTQLRYRLEDLAHLRRTHDHPAEPVRAMHQMGERHHLACAVSVGRSLMRAEFLRAVECPRAAPILLLSACNGRSIAYLESK